MKEWAPRNPNDHPPMRYEDYKSTLKRSPIHAPVAITPSLSEMTGPGPAIAAAANNDADLTTNAGTGHEALGSRTIITGRVLDDSGAPVPHALVEIWQANAAGRYRHVRETAFPAPLDPHFIGAGQCITDVDGRYRFITIRPGPYPWGNHPNAWRPAHIHFSVFGPAWVTRLVTQMYFPGDELLALDPIFLATPAHARERLIAAYDHDVTEARWALGYRFDVVLRGPKPIAGDP